MRMTTPAEAIRAIGPGRCLVASPGCGTPSTLLDALGRLAGHVAGSRLHSGLLLCDYPFLDAVREGQLGYRTWHVMPPVRQLVADGLVDFYPVRGSQVPRLIEYHGFEVALVRVSPPDRHGFCSLGPAVSYSAAAVRCARLVLAEIDEELPRTVGDGAVHVDDIDLAVPSEVSTPQYGRAQADDASRAIAKHIRSLLPPAPTLQIGIGAIPEALLDELLDAEVGELRFAGMGADGMVDLADAGLLAPVRSGPPQIVAAELMGGRRLMDFADRNPRIGVYQAPVSSNPQQLATAERFVSINSGVEIDLRGQVNSEWAGGRQLSGTGGSLDFVEAAIGSVGGRRIVALTSTAGRDGGSKIVRTLSTLGPVTLPRSTAEYVVTEYGIAHLAYATERERAEALAAIAHPDHRATLLDGLQETRPETSTAPPTQGERTTT